MIKFLDGPAGGVSLNLQRAPVFLRVVIDRQGKIDALDQIDDEPAHDEQIFVYRLHGKASSGIACSRGKGGGCRPFAIAEYKFCQEQPEDGQARDRKRWYAWAREAYTKEQRP